MHQMEWKPGTPGLLVGLLSGAIFFQGAIISSWLNISLIPVVTGIVSGGY